MPLPDPIAYLHDCRLLQILVSCEESGSKSIVFSIVFEVQTDPDFELKKWQNQKIRIIFVNSILIDATVLGHILNADCVSSIDERYPQIVSAVGQRLSTSGIASPRLQVVVSLSSGSEFVISCDEATIATAM